MPSLSTGFPPVDHNILCLTLHGIARYCWRHYPDSPAIELPVAYLRNFRQVTARGEQSMHTESAAPSPVVSHLSHGDVHAPGHDVRATAPGGFRVIRRN